MVAGLVFCIIDYPLFMSPGQRLQILLGEQLVQHDEARPDCSSIASIGRASSRDGSVVAGFAQIIGSGRVAPMMRRTDEPPGVVGS